MVRVAVRGDQAAPGAKLTWKVALPPAATGDAGCWVTVKSAALAPLTATLGVPVRFSARAPVFWMVNICTCVPPPVSAQPKSVAFAGMGGVFPFGMDTPLPVMLISGM